MVWFDEGNNAAVMALALIHLDWVPQHLEVCGLVECSCYGNCAWPNITECLRMPGA